MQTGDRVVLQGLVAKPELNGKQGTLLHFNSKRQRWGVKIDGEAEGMMLKPSNLRAVDNLSPAPKQPDGLSAAYEAPPAAPAAAPAAPSAAAPAATEPTTAPLPAAESPEPAPKAKQQSPTSITLTPDAGTKVPSGQVLPPPRPCLRADITDRAPCALRPASSICMNCTSYFVLPTSYLVLPTSYMADDPASIAAPRPPQGHSPRLLLCRRLSHECCMRHKHACIHVVHFAWRSFRSYCEATMDPLPPVKPLTRDQGLRYTRPGVQGRGYEVLVATGRGEEEQRRRRRCLGRSS